MMTVSAIFYSITDDLFFNTVVTLSLPPDVRISETDNMLQIICATLFTPDRTVKDIGVNFNTVDITGALYLGTMGLQSMTATLWNDLASSLHFFKVTTLSGNLPTPLKMAL